MNMSKVSKNYIEAGVKTISSLLLGTILLITAFHSASAVEAGFSTTVTSTNTADTAFLVGTEIRIILDVDAAAFDDNADPTVGSYDFGINTWSAEFPDDGLFFQFGNSFMTVFSEAPGSLTDQLFIGTTSNLNNATLAGSLIAAVDFQLRSSDDSTFPNDDIPTSIPNTFDAIEISFLEVGSTIATLVLSPDISPLQPSISDLITDLGQCVTDLGLNNNYFQMRLSNWYQRRLIKALNFHEAGADALARFQMILFIIGIEAKRGWLIAHDDADIIVDKAIDILAELY